MSSKGHSEEVKPLTSKFCCYVMLGKGPVTTEPSQTPTDRSDAR